MAPSHGARPTRGRVRGRSARHPSRARRSHQAERGRASQRRVFPIASGTRPLLRDAIAKAEQSSSPDPCGKEEEGRGGNPGRRGTISRRRQCSPRRAWLLQPGCRTRGARCPSPRISSCKPWWRCRNVERQRSEFARQLRRKVDNQAQVDAWRELEDATIFASLRTTAVARRAQARRWSTPICSPPNCVPGRGQPDHHGRFGSGDDGPQKPLRRTKISSSAPGDVVDVALETKGVANALNAQQVKEHDSRTSLRGAGRRIRPHGRRMGGNRMRVLLVHNFYRIA